MTCPRCGARAAWESDSLRLTDRRVGTRLDYKERLRRDAERRRIKYAEKKARERRRRAHGWPMSRAGQGDRDQRRHGQESGSKPRPRNVASIGRRYRVLHVRHRKSQCGIEASAADGNANDRPPR
jgi:hypothetical protein